MSGTEFLTFGVKLQSSNRIKIKPEYQIHYKIIVGSSFIKKQLKDTHTLISGSKDITSPLVTDTADPHPSYQQSTEDTSSHLFCRSADPRLTHSRGGFALTVEVLTQLYAHTVSVTHQE